MNPHESDLAQISVLIREHKDYTPKQIAQWAASTDAATAHRGLAMQTASLYSDGRLNDALHLLVSAQARFSVLPPSLFTLLFHLHFLTGRTADLPELCLTYGQRAIEQGLFDIGLEAMQLGLIHDRTGVIYHNAPRLIQSIEHYETVAQNLARYPRRPRRTGDSLLRIGMLVANLIDHFVAYSNRVIHFARHLDTERFRLFVYCSEGFALRSHQLPMLMAAKPTSDAAPVYLQELNARGIPVHIAQTDTSIALSASAIARRIQDDQIDILIHQSSPQIPLDWLVTRLASVPAKLHIHIGTSIYQRELDVTLFDNAINMKREAATWPAYAGRQTLLRRGPDIDAFDAVAPMDRNSAGIPENAILIGTMSNHLAERLSPAYLNVMKDVLQAEPDAWLAAIGGRVPAHVVDCFKKAGVSGRVRYLPQQTQPAAALKMLDIYVNEFPAGGSQSVVEAMVCGRPVVAMRCGNTHHESVGADIVGPPSAIETYDLLAFRDLILAWIRNPIQRRQVGAALRQRAEREFSIKDYVRKVCDLGAAIVSEKQAASL